MFEAFGPCRFAGWAKGGEVYEDPWGLGFRYVYSPGEPMGKPVTAPFIRCMATEEGQTGNVYATIYYNLTDEDCPLFFVPGVDVGLKQVLLPNGGAIMVSTASAASKDGGKETFVCFDESHLYNLPELRQMYKTVTRNLRKRKRIAQTWYLETTTMFNPSEDSVAQKTYEEAEAIREGRKRRGRARLYYDHRYGECADVRVEADLRAAIMEAFGEAINWNDIDGIVDEFYDTRADEQSSRRFFLNAQTSAADAWLKFEQWDACKRPAKGLQAKDFVALGLDGSLRDDATALVATRISDGHQELLGCWEKPEDGPDDWEVDREAVDAAVAAAFRKFEVGAFFADPPHFGDYIARWTNQWKDQLQAWGQAKNKPIEYWTTRSTVMVESLSEYHQAVLEQRVTYTPPEDRASKEQDLAVTFTRHVLNARRNEKNRSGLLISKEAPKSKKKIDACMAAVISWAARTACITNGAKPKSKLTYAAKRIR